MHVYYGTNLSPTNLIFDSSEVIGNGTFNVAFRTNDLRIITIVMDEGRSLTEWVYTNTITGPGFGYQLDRIHRQLPEAAVMAG